MPRDFALEARLWIARNPSGFRLIEQSVLAEAARTGRASVKRAVEELRKTFVAEQSYALNNSYASTFARELIRRHPHLSSAIELRHSVKLDPPAHPARPPRREELTSGALQLDILSALGGV